MSDSSPATDGGDGSEAPTPGESTVRCQCPLAPELCLADINPASATFATKGCIAATPDPGTVLFFGNVLCSHCESIFENLLAIQSRLRNDRLNPRLTFVQLKTFTHTPEVVSSTFPQHNGPVLQDTQATDAWSVYAADWYHVMIIDSHGCLGEHYRPPQTHDLLGTAGAEVEAAWRRSLSKECP